MKSQAMYYDVFVIKTKCFRNKFLAFSSMIMLFIIIISLLHLSTHVLLSDYLFSFRHSICVNYILPRRPSHISFLQSLSVAHVIQENERNRDNEKES